ncbi:hypothetical protein IF2G_11110 [Cordyceps javanica]|nr:hypothetical protein IF2G_11110 [Cordyceps javanica]
MSLFVEEEANARIWKQSWRLIWPKDDYLEKLLDRGLTPVLGGYSLLAQAIDECDELKAGEPKAGEPKTGEHKADEPKAGEPEAGEPKAGEHKAGEPKTDEPKVGKSEGESFNFVFGVVKNKPDLPEKLEDILGENFFQEFKESLPSDAIFNDAKTKVTIPSTKTCFYFGLHDGQFWPKEVEDMGCFARSVQGAQTTAVIFYSDPGRALHTCVEGSDNMLVFTGGFAAVLPDGVGVDKVAWCVSEPQRG